MSESNSPKNQPENPKSGLSTPIVLSAIIAAALGIWLSSQFFSYKPVAKISGNIISGTFLKKTKSLADFKLTDHNNKDFSIKSLKGKWTFLFFGYTHCPDVCPNTLAVLKAMANELEKNPQGSIDYSNTQYVFVSVDPARDTPAQLKTFVQYFNKKFIGVTGPHPALQKLTKQLGILYSVEDKKNTTNEKKSYTVDHSAYILLINPKAHFQALFSYPHNARKMLKDYKTIRRLIKD